MTCPPETFFWRSPVIIGLFADVHANREALEACLDHARRQGVEKHIFLGDLVGYGADPEWVIDRLAEYQDKGAVVVLGNHDEAVFKDPGKSMHDEAREAIPWTTSRLSPKQIRFLEALPLTAQDSNCLYVHASALKPSEWEYVVSLDQARKSLSATSSRVTFCGHVHENTLYHQSATGKMLTFSPIPGVAIPLSGQRRWLAMVGAVGQPRDGNPATGYAIYDSVSSFLTYYRLPYDRELAVRKIREAGLPEWLATRLEMGV